MEAVGALVEQGVVEEVEVLVGGVTREGHTETVMGMRCPIEVDIMAVRESVEVMDLMGQKERMEKKCNDARPALNGAILWVVSSPDGGVLYQSGHDMMLRL